MFEASVLFGVCFLFVFFFFFLHKTAAVLNHSSLPEDLSLFPGRNVTSQGVLEEKPRCVVCWMKIETNFVLE